MADTILVATDGSPWAVAAERMAVALAAEHGWRLLGLHVVDPRMLSAAYLADLGGATAAAFPPGFFARLEQALEARGEAVLDGLASACAEARVPFERRLGHGFVDEAVCAAARAACVVALGRLGAAGPWQRRILGSTAETASRRSPVPVLVMPGESPVPHRLLVAYDGGPQAGIALTWAARLARKGTHPVAVLAVHEDAEEARRIAGVGCALLETEGVAATAVHRHHDPAEEILAEATTGLHDVVIMGSSRHHIFRDWLLGGTASRVMHESPVPVLLCR